MTDIRRPGAQANATMTAMTGPSEPHPDPQASPTPEETGGDAPRRRLERSPSERLTGDDPSTGQETAPSGSPGRAIALGAVGAVVGVVIFLVLAIGFSFTAGLLVVAIFIGRFVGLFVRSGAGATLSSAARVVAAVGIFLVALLVALVAIWLWSRTEGGDLALLDYLDQVYGTPLIALEFMLGTLMTWWSAR
jgi:hypothetical protein